MRLKLFEFCEELAFRLRDHGLRGRTLSIKARFWNFKTVTRSHTLEFPTNLGARMWSVARELLDRVPPGPLRLLGVQISALEDVRTPLQGQLFAGGAPQREDAGDQRLSRATEGLDKLRRKYGAGTVVPASLLR